MLGFGSIRIPITMSGFIGRFFMIKCANFLNCVIQSIIVGKFVSDIYTLVACVYEEQ